MDLFLAIEQERDLASLLAQGHNPNVIGEFADCQMTPLHLATLHSRVESARALLEAGAHPNSTVLSGQWVGMTALDLAMEFQLGEMVELLAGFGGEPGHTTPNSDNPAFLFHLGRARAVGTALSLVIAPALRPLIEQAQRSEAWDEADRLLRRIQRHEGEDERTLHLRIRGLIARGEQAEALAEASLVFLHYRRQGRYREALQVTRSMRRIDPRSPRPLELEMEFLVDLGWLEQAEATLRALIELHRRREDVAEITACKARFAVLSSRPRVRRLSRPPEAWQVPDALPEGSSSNLPALLDEEEPPEWLEVWWD